MCFRTGSRKILLFAALSVFLSSCTGLITPTGFDSFTASQGYDTSSFSRFLQVAAVCMESNRDDKQANLDTIASLAETVMGDHPDTDVIVFPELCTSWLLDTDDPAGYYGSVAEIIPGPSTDWVKALASRLDTSIVFGLAEVDGDRYYNSQALLKPDGSLITYRKRGLNAGDIMNGCSPGEGVVSTQINGIEVTFAICSDYQDETVIQDLSVHSAPIVLASLVTATILNPQVGFFSRSIGKWVVFANGGGSNSNMHMPGNIYIADPTGTMHAENAGPGTYSWFSIGVPE